MTDALSLLISTVKSDDSRAENMKRGRSPRLVSYLLAVSRP
jgi:hypothetical protein